MSSLRLPPLLRRSVLRAARQAGAPLPTLQQQRQPPPRGVMQGSHLLRGGISRWLVLIICFIVTALLYIHSRTDALLPFTSLTRHGTLLRAAVGPQPTRTEQRLSLAPADLHVEDDLSQPLSATYSELIAYYLQPWKLEDGPHITTRMLDVMELLYDGAAFRIRVIDNQLYLRVSKWWPDTYKINRMNWYLKTIQLLLQHTKMPNFDAVLSMSDGGRVSLDSTLGKDAAFPLFSLIRTNLHIDIPLPDPVAFGSNGNYMWPDQAKQVPWAERKPVALFRGSLSSYLLHADNWHSGPRVRLVKLSQAHPDLLDAGITDWKQAEKRQILYPMSSGAEIGNSTGITLSPPMKFLEQASYKYIMDIEGGTGSSRKPGILDSGSLLIAQQTPFYRHVDALLVHGVHYMAVDRYFKSLLPTVEWLQQHDAEAETMMLNGRAFVQRHYNMDAILLYLEILFKQYSALLAEAVTLDPVHEHNCRAEVQTGPQGCTMEFTLWDGEPFNTAPFKDKDTK